MLWILVMNATRARILRGLDPSGKPLRPELAMRSAHRLMRDALSGAVPAALGRRSTVQALQHSLREDDAAFASQVASFLETHRMAGDFGQLAVVAKPEVLQPLEAAMPQRLRGVMTERITMDLIDLGVIELAARVAALLQTA